MMITNGMLWFDDDAKRPFVTKVELAAQYFKTKYGNDPNVVYVHPSCMPQDNAAQALRVVAMESVLPHHFLLGVARSKEGISEV